MELDTPAKEFAKTLARFQIAILPPPSVLIYFECSYVPGIQRVPEGLLRTAVASVAVGTTVWVVGSLSTRAALKVDPCDALRSLMQYQTEHFFL